MDTCTVFFGEFQVAAVNNIEMVLVLVSPMFNLTLTCIKSRKTAKLCYLSISMGVFQFSQTIFKF